MSQRLDCKFCADLRINAPYLAAVDRPLLETDHLRVVPSIGSIVEGWTLVIPKHHALAVSRCPAPVRRDMERVVLDVARKSTSLYRRRIVLFEHGPARAGLNVGCSVDHAHLHVVPFEGDLLAFAQATAPELRWVAMSGVLPPAGLTQSYLFLRDQDGNSWLGTGLPIPSQLFRRAIASYIDMPDTWSWRDFPRPEVAARTSERLRSVLTDVAVA